MKFKPLICLAIICAIGISAKSEILNWQIEYGTSFDTVAIGRTTDPNAKGWNNGVYIGFGDIVETTPVANIQVPSGYYSMGQTTISDFGNTSEYYYYIELRSGTGKVAYTALTDWEEIQYYMGDVPYASWELNAANFTPVPEPSSGLLLLIGGALVGLRRKRRVA